MVVKNCIQIKILKKIYLNIVKWTHFQNNVPHSHVVIGNISSFSILLNGDQ